MQVVEDDERSQFQIGIDGAARRQPDHATGAALAQRPDVPPMVDEIRKPRMPDAVAGDVDHVDPVPAALGTSTSPNGVLTSTACAASNPGSE